MSMNTNIHKSIWAVVDVSFTMWHMYWISMKGLLLPVSLAPILWPCVISEGPVVHPQLPLATVGLGCSRLGPGWTNAGVNGSWVDGIEPGRGKGNWSLFWDTGWCLLVCVDCSIDPFSLCVGWYINVGCSWADWDCALPLSASSSESLSVSLDMISPLSSWYNGDASVLSGKSAYSPITPCLSDCSEDDKGQLKGRPRKFSVPKIGLSCGTPLSGFSLCVSSTLSLEMAMTWSDTGKEMERRRFHRRSMAVV